jgi:hypothetical protein
MGHFYQRFKDCTTPDPLRDGNEQELCEVGYLLNFEHAEVRSKESAAHIHMNEASDAAARLERFEQLKEVVAERHEIMRAQFSHVKDCFVCSVAFGLTPAVKPKSDRMRFGQLLARFVRGGWFSRTKTGFQRI